MPLKGELNDLSLAEVIEFFCNQRKTGRLTVSYPQAPAYFYLQSGSVVHAAVGSLRGIEAVYYALTQSNASFNFSTAYEAPEQTINQPWTSVVLEGLRRMDEGIKPRSPIAEKHEPVGETVIPPQPTIAEPPSIEPLANVEAPAESISTVTREFVEAPEVQQKIDATPAPVAHTVEAPPVAEISSPRVEQNLLQADADSSHPTPEIAVKNAAKDKINVNNERNAAPRAKTPKVSESFLGSTQHASQFSHRPWKVAAIFAALVLIIAGVAIPWSLRVRGKSTKAAEQPTVIANESSQPAQPVVENDGASQSGSEIDPQTQAADPNLSAPTSDNSEAARRAREARAREEAKLKAKGTEASGTTTNTPAPTTTSAPPASGSAPKKVAVQVTYDENGRVTQATGNDPTALRIARQKRFPPGKAGSTTITIPIN